MSWPAQKKGETRNTSLDKADLEARVKGLEDLQLLLQYQHLKPGLKPPQGGDKGVKSFL